MFNKLLFASIAVLLSLPSWAVQTYIGGEGGQRRVRYDHGYGDNLLPSRQAWGNLFVGFQIDRRLAFEFGYGFVDVEARKEILRAGERAFGGVAITGANFSEYNATARYRMIHGDIVGTYPLDSQNIFGGLIVLGLEQLRMKFHRIEVANQAGPVEPHIPASVEDKAYALRWGVGLSFFPSEYYGMRGLLIFEPLLKDNIRSVSRNGEILEVRPKTIYGFTIGVVAKF